MKKRTPVNAWQKIEPLVREYRDLFVAVPHDKYAFYLIDADPDSDFYFYCGFQDREGKVPFRYKPASMDSVHEFGDNVTLESLAVYFQRWCEVLRAYQETTTFYDDPIVDSY